MAEPALAEIWVYLSASPLLGLTITLAAYSVAHRLYVFANGNPLLNPVVTSIAMLIGFLLLTDTSYADYFEGGQYVHFLLGPATVALAIPLYQQAANLKKLWLPLSITLFSGASIGALSAVLLAKFLDAGLQTQLSLAPKSVTAPVAMGISENIGGIPSLTAAFVAATGIFGAIVGTKLLALLRFKDNSTIGVALGLSAHGIGTARAFQVNSEMGAFAGLAMALSALITAFIVPWLVELPWLVN